MVNENKGNVFAALVGIVVGAGAVIAGALALSDKKNQNKVKAGIENTKKLVKVVKNAAEKGAKNI